MGEPAEGYAEENRRGKMLLVRRYVYISLDLWLKVKVVFTVTVREILFCSTFI